MTTIRLVRSVDTRAVRPETLQNLALLQLLMFVLALAALALRFP